MQRIRRILLTKSDKYNLLSVENVCCIGLHDLEEKKWRNGTVVKDKKYIKEAVMLCSASIQTEAANVPCKKRDKNLVLILNVDDI